MIFRWDRPRQTRRLLALARFRWLIEGVSGAEALKRRPRGVSNGCRAHQNRAPRRRALEVEAYRESRAASLWERRPAAMDAAVTPNGRVTRPAPSRRDAAPTGDMHLPGWLMVVPWP